MFSLAGLKELVFGFTGREPGVDERVSECREPAAVDVRSRSLPCWAPIALNVCTSPAGKSSKLKEVESDGYVMGQDCLICDE